MHHQIKRSNNLVVRVFEELNSVSNKLFKSSLHYLVDWNVGQKTENYQHRKNHDNLFFICELDKIQIIFQFIECLPSDYLYNNRLKSIYRLFLASFFLSCWGTNLIEPPALLIISIAVLLASWTSTLIGLSISPLTINLTRLLAEPIRPLSKLLSYLLVFAFNVVNWPV